MARRTYPNLARTPIVEALIDLRISGRTDSAVDGLKHLCADIVSTYPRCEQLTLGQAQISLAPSPADSHVLQDRRLFGFRLTSADGKHVAVLTEEGFTFSRLQPYDRWESLRSEAQLLWDRYSEVVKPDKISRVALRYINRLDIPPSFRDLKDYLTAPPEVPARLPQVLGGFLTQILIPLERIGATATITQQLEARNFARFMFRRQKGLADSEPISLLLDIDVFKAVELDPSSREAWELADQMRDEKNVIFFESITEKMEDLCT